MMHGLYVFQEGQTYHVYLPQGIQVATIYMSNDGQYMNDALAMKAITSVLAKRWGVSKANQQVQVSEMEPEGSIFCAGTVEGVSEMTVKIYYIELKNWGLV